MQIKKAKGVVSVKLTQYERRQLEGAQEIIDTVRALGGTADDIETLVSGNGTVTINGSKASDDDEESGDEEPEKYTVSSLKA